MADASALERLERGSKRSAVLVLVGTIAVLGALFVSTREVQRKQARLALLSAEADSLQARNDSLRSQIGGLREALGASRAAITAFHQGDYATAVSLYDRAIKKDSGNAYLLNLRAYALFKQHRLEDALASELLSVNADSTYAWGYFDLARFQCALGKRPEARQAIARARALDTSIATIMRMDGEFKNLCRDLVP